MKDVPPTLKILALCLFSVVLSRFLFSVTRHR
jgi:hypothetical protein